MTLLVGETNDRSSVHTFVHRYELDTSAPDVRVGVPRPRDAGAVPRRCSGGWSWSGSGS